MSGGVLSNMMSFELRVDTSGLQQLRVEVQNLIASATALIAAELMEYEGEVFETEGAASGEKWQPISEATKQKRQRMGVNPNNPILQARGILSRSYKVFFNPSFPIANCTLYFDDVYSIWDKELVNLPDAHHFGAGPRYPRRPLFNEEVVEKRVAEKIQSFLGGK